MGLYQRVTPSLAQKKMARRNTVDVEEFLRLARQEVSSLRLASRFGVSVATVRILAREHRIKLPGIKEMRRKNGLPASTKWEPPPR
jgi:hypothetical protein